jgi:hypothetical protein
MTHGFSRLSKCSTLITFDAPEPFTAPSARSHSSAERSRFSTHLRTGQAGWLKPSHLSDHFSHGVYWPNLTVSGAIRHFATEPFSHRSIVIVSLSRKYDGTESQLNLPCSWAFHLLFGTSREALKESASRMLTYMRTYQLPRRASLGPASEKGRLLSCSYFRFCFYMYLPPQVNKIIRHFRGAFEDLRK